MALFAHVVSGIVHEPLQTFPNAGGYTLEQCFHPDFAPNWIDVTAANPQPEEGWLATETAGVWTFAAPPAPPAPTAAKVAQTAYDAAVAAGVTIISTGTPALNGVYALDQLNLSRITSEQVCIATTGKFTNGQASRAWLDQSGAPHTFPSAAAFTSFAEAVAQYDDALIAALDAGLAGAAWAAPSPPAAIP